MIIRKTNRRRRGSAVLEAALVMPVLCYLTFGCIEFGDYFYMKHTLQGAAREGARAAATGTTNTDVTTAVGNCMNAAGIPSTNYTVTIQDTSNNNLTISSTTPVSGTAIVVNVTCIWGTVGIRPMSFMSSTKKVIGTTTMRREG